MQTYDAVFFVSVGTIVIGFFSLIIKYCLKSKCENIRLCGGLIQIKRRVDLETDIEIHEIDVNSKDSQFHPENNLGLPEEELDPEILPPQRRGRKPKNLGSFYPRKDLLPRARNPTLRGDPPTHFVVTSSSAQATHKTESKSDELSLDEHTQP